jgi:hypothetical protein
MQKAFFGAFFDSKNRSGFVESLLAQKNAVQDVSFTAMVVEAIGPQH